MPILIILGMIIITCVVGSIYYIVQMFKKPKARSYDYLAMTAADLQKIKEEIEEKETAEEYKKCKRLLYEVVTGTEDIRIIPLKYHKNVQKLQDEGFHVTHNGLNWVVYPQYNKEYKIIASFDWCDIPHKALEEFFEKYTNLIIEECPVEGRLLIKKRIYK